jgi:hypothetical protein
VGAECQYQADEEKGLYGKTQNLNKFLLVHNKILRLGCIFLLVLFKFFDPVFNAENAASIADPRIG